MSSAVGAASLAVSAMLLLSSASPVAAHGELILELGAERIQPGGSVEVRGDLGTGDVFEIALISRSGGARRVIASVPAAGEGHFDSYVVVPADVPVGDYFVEAAVDLIVVRAPLTVAGSPLGDTGAGEPQREDGFLSPLPSGFGRAGVVPVASAGGAPPADASRGTDPAGGVPLGGLLLVVIAALVPVGVLGLVWRARRPRQAPPG